MSISPITNTYHPNFKGTVDDSVKKVVFEELKNYCEHETFVANNTQESLDTAKLKTIVETTQNALKKLESFMKKCHPDTKIVYTKKSYTKNHFRIINKKMTEGIIRFENIPFSEKKISGPRININEPSMSAFGYVDSLNKFTNFVDNLANSINAQDIDKALLIEGQKDCAGLLSKSTFLNDIKINRKAKKLEKIAKELGFNELVDDIRFIITEYNTDKKAGKLQSQAQKKLEVANKKAMKEILDNSNIID